jgi:transposase
VRGQTPVQISSARHDRLSVIGALTVAPQRKRLGLFFEVQSKNVVAHDVIKFLRELHRQLRRPILLVCDRWSVHRSAVRQLQEQGVRWLHVEWLPAYAPDLNPVECLWGHTKYSDLANFVPDDLQHLEDNVIESLCDQYEQHELKRSFFAQAGLAL